MHDCRNHVFSASLYQKAVTSRICGKLLFCRNHVITFNANDITVLRYYYSQFSWYFTGTFWYKWNNFCKCISFFLLLLYMFSRLLHRKSHQREALSLTTKIPFIKKTKTKTKTKNLDLLYFFFSSRGIRALLTGKHILKQYYSVRNHNSFENTPKRNLFIEIIIFSLWQALCYSDSHNITSCCYWINPSLYFNLNHINKNWTRYNSGPLRRTTPILLSYIAHSLLFFYSYFYVYETPKGHQRLYLLHVCIKERW